MSDEILLSIEKKTDILIEKTKTNHQETLEFKLKHPDKQSLLILH